MVVVYLGFVALILSLLALDLGVFHRKAHVVRVKEALGWSAVWISLGLAFAGFIYLGYDHHWFGLGTRVDAMGTPQLEHGVLVYNDGASAAIKYLTGFVVEKSLAVDNLFVIVMIFAFLRVPPVYQHRVLFWGIVGALVLRGLMIGVGAVLIVRFSWVIYVFGGFLILTGIKMLVVGDKPKDLGRSRLVRLARRLLRVTESYHGPRFVVRAGVTPLFLALLLVELTDVIFAVDSIPAIFAITTDPFLVFTSNVFAVLGMRSLYFALAGVIETFHYLKVALSLVLVVIGVKMLVHAPLKAWLGAHFNFYVLGVVALVLGAGVVASLVSLRRARATAAAPARAA